MSEKKTGDERADDLALCAMLYAAGEMDAAAVAEFEVRLRDDPAAPEALALAVRLNRLLADDDLRPNPAYRATIRGAVRARRWRRRRRNGIAAVLGLGAAACLALLMSNSRPANSPESPTIQPIEAALASAPVEPTANLPRRMAADDPVEASDDEELPLPMEIQKDLGTRHDEMARIAEGVAAAIKQSAATLLEKAKKRKKRA